MNICKYIINNNLPHKIVDGKVVQNGTLDLLFCKWAIKKVGKNKVKIGCKTKTINGWKKFFENKESYETDAYSKEYKEIEKTFKMYCIYQ